MKNKYTTKYTKEEEDFIRKNYGNLSNRKIGESLSNRTPWAIKKKMQYMGLSRSQEETKKIILDSKREYKKYSLGRFNRKLITVNGERMLKSHYVWSKEHNRKVPKGFVVHHKDLNPKNDSSKNLKLMTKAKHNKLHTSNKGLYGLMKRSK